MIELIILMLIQYEGFSEKAYYDVKGYSVGYGFQYIDGKKVGRDTVITREEALVVLRRKVTRLAAKVEGPTNVRMALIMMHYQMGHFRFPKALKAMSKGDYETMAKEVLDSKFARQTPTRAADMAALIRGDYEISITKQRPALQKKLRRLVSEVQE